MIASVLRTSLLLVVAAAVTLALWLLHIGAPLWVALAAAAMLPLALHGVPLAIEFLVGAVIDRRATTRLGPLALARLWWGETWRSAWAFDVDQPWRDGFAEPPLQRDPARPAVLFVHGYLCNRAVWRPMLLHTGLTERWNVATVNLEPAFASIDSYADTIAAAVEGLRERSGAARVTLVCHSMGGLAARAYLQRHGVDSVTRVVTIDTPHAGTLFAALAHGVNARQMRRGSPFLADLAAHPPPVEFICFAGQHDNLIVPRASQVLADAEAVWFAGVGHLAMTACEDVRRALIQAVERAPAPRRACALP